VGVVGVSVGAVAGSAFDPVPIGRDEADEVVPEAVGRVAVQKRRLDVGQRLPIGLSDVEGRA